MTKSGTPTGAGEASDFAKSQVQSPESRVQTLPSRDRLERLGRIASRLGTRSFLVGGPVRDLVLRAGEVRCQKLDVRSQKSRTSGLLHSSLCTLTSDLDRGQAMRCLGSIPDSGRGPDIDIAVEDKCHEFGAAVARELGGRFVFHSRFLSGSVLSPLASRLSPLAHIDVTQTRTEVYARPAVLPQVKPASIVADLARRDFSINAMALEITPDAFGTFIDPYNGRDDLASRRVRILHERSFVDDPTRIFRCIRFAIRLGFAIEPDTLKLMRQAIEHRYPALLTPERILYELRLICAEPLVLPMVEALVHERVLEAAWRWTPPRGFVSSMAKLARLRGGRNPRGQSPAQERRNPGQSPDFAELLFIYWLSVLPVTDRFPIRKEERDAAEAVAAAARLKHKLKHKQNSSAIYQVLRDQPETALLILAALEPQPVARHIKAFLAELRHASVSVTGADLRAAGLKPGPAYREILDKLLFARLDGKIRTVADERELLTRLIKRLGRGRDTIRNRRADFRHVLPRAEKDA
jgi:tRNA nucleotidyltransferase (CCA-adding enzyme)